MTIHFIGDGGHAKVCRGIDYQTTRPCTFVAIGDNAVRKREAERASGPFATLIHPNAIFPLTALIDEGTVLMAGAIVQPGARIGRHCIINTGATVDHDCVIEDYAHIAPGAHLCGGVHVGEGALVGVGVGIEPGVVIPKWSVVKRIPYVIEPVSGHATA